MNYPLTILAAQALQEDARRAGERQARVLEAIAEKQDIAHINRRRPERRPSLLRRLLRAA